MKPEELPKSRAEARAIGARHYFTGLPCKNGHIDIRTVSKACCMECTREAKRKLRANGDFRDAEREYQREYARKQRKENREEENRKLREWRSNPEVKLRIKAQKKALESKPENIEKRRIYARKRYNDVPEVRISTAISAGIRKSISRDTKGGRKWESLVGYTVDQLRAHLEKQFLPGMAWSNYGDWHIDHKIPIAAHNFTTPDDIDFKRCWALTNLRPMWGGDNISKGAKLTGPFQPSLALAIPTNDTKKESANVA